MLLNPSHTLTWSGLSPDLLDAYVRYKKGTRAIVTWLLQYGSMPHSTAARLSLRDLASLAKVACTRVSEIPPTVDFQFRETIGARQYLSRRFRNRERSGDSPDTQNHEFFTVNLESIYAELCRCCGKPEAECDTHEQSAPRKEHGRSLANTFSLLDMQADVRDGDDDNGSAPPLEVCSECAVPTATTCPDAASSMCLEDDDIGRSIELAALLHELDDLRTTIIDCWRNAARKRSSLMIPASVTNVAMIMVKDIARRIGTVNESGSLEAIHQVCHLLEDPDRGKETGPPSRWHQLLDELREAWMVIQCYRKKSITLELPTVVRKAAEFIQPSGSADSRKTAALHLLMANVLEQLGVVAEKPSSALPPIGIGESPFIMETKQAVGCRDTHTSELLASISLTLLYTTHQAYLHPNTIEPAQPQKPSGQDGCTLQQNPRIDALRYANDILKSLRSLLNAHPPVPQSTFPCRCNQTLAYHIEVLRLELESFVGSCHWDLLHQSPWMAGCQMLDIMHRAAYYGSKLLRYRNFVGATIHVYSALRVADPLGFKPIIVLEAVCEELKDIFFPSGGRPQRNFYKGYVRYLGGRLKFQKGHARQRTMDSWCMAIPGHAARESSGLGVGMSEGSGKKEEGCGLLPRLAQAEYTIDKDSWRAICEHCADAQQRTKSSVKDSQRQRLELEKAPCSYLLKCLETATTAEINSGLPIIKLDVFRLYAACVKVVEKVSELGHEKGDGDGGTIRCLCFVEHLMSAAERRVRARTERVENRVWTKDEKRLVEMISTTLNDVFERSEVIKGGGDPNGLEGWKWHI